MPSTQVVCKDFGAGTEPKDVAVDEADMSLYEDNGHFDMAKFLKAIAKQDQLLLGHFMRPSPRVRDRR